MIIVLRSDASFEQIEQIQARVRELDLEPFVLAGAERTIIGIIGSDVERVRALASLPGVDQLVPISHPYKLASSDHHPQRSAIEVGNVVIGNDAPLVLIAGPCAVESREQLMATAAAVRSAGASMLRGGAFKPRTSPYKFQGHGYAALEWLAEAAATYGLPVTSEITDPADVEIFERHVDMLQVGARNMQNFVLLKAVGQSRKPVMLKRGLAATIEEWLLAAEYIMSCGNPNVVLCERGIRTFETATRNTLDLSAVPVLRGRTHLPVLVDPSHGTGQRPLVGPMALAGAAVGADGLIIEVHPDPPSALSDGEQSLSFGEFGTLTDDLRRHRHLEDRAPTPVPSQINPVRGRIDEVDAQLIALLEQRAALALEAIAARKDNHHGHDMTRESQIVARAVDAANYISAHDMRLIYGAILRACRETQRRNNEGSRT